MSAIFRTALIQLLDERSMSITPTEELTGDELREATENNAGISQMIDEICKLHDRMTEPAAKTKPAAKPAKETETAEEKPKRAPRKAKENADAEEKPKRARKTESKPTETDAAEKPKRAAGNYATFTSRVTQANKGDTTSWGDVKVTVSFAKVSAAGQALLDHAAGAQFLALKDTEVTMLQLLDQAKALLTAADGKVHPFKLSGLLWSAVGNVDPFAA